MTTESADSFRRFRDAMQIGMDTGLFHLLIVYRYDLIAHAGRDLPRNPPANDARFTIR